MIIVLLSSAYRPRYSSFHGVHVFATHFCLVLISFSWFLILWNAIHLLVPENIILNNFVSGRVQRLLLIKEVPMEAMEVIESVFSGIIRSSLKCATSHYKKWMNHGVINRFQANILFICLLEKSENQRFLTFSGQ